MKESDYRRKELEEVKDDDSDFKYFNKKVKLDRALRSEKFEDKALPEIKAMGFKVWEVDNGWAIELSKNNVCVFYPKSGSVYFKKRKNWKKKIGYEWLKKYVLDKYKS